MSKQENGYSRRKRLGMKLNFILRQRVLVGVAAMLMGASLVFSGSASAHNIDLDKAWEQTRNYARLVRKESGGKYLHYTTNCVEAFPNHNHIVRCVITYQNKRDRAAGVYTCKETIEVYMPPHGRSNTEVYTLHARHTSGNTCGSRQRLEDTPGGFFSNL